ncbi:uncharacterized protein RBU33_004342 isoform 2-T3 [Hipposideros larvatus]
MGKSGERKRSRVETPPGSRGGRRGKAKAKGGCGAVPAAAAAAAAWATGRARSALKSCRRSIPASLALLGPGRFFSVKSWSPGIVSLSHFVRSLLGRLPRCPAGQGEVGARWRLRKAWRASGSTRPRPQHKKYPTLFGGSSRLEGE